MSLDSYSMIVWDSAARQYRECRINKEQLRGVKNLCSDGGFSSIDSATAWTHLTRSQQTLMMVDLDALVKIPAFNWRDFRTTWADMRPRFNSVTT